MAFSVADEEASEAIKAYWDTDSDLGGIFGSLKKGRLKSADIPKDKSGQAQPYAKIEVSQSQPQSWNGPIQKNSSYRDYRLVRLIGWGTYAQCKTLAIAIMTKLSWLPRDG